MNVIFAKAPNKAPNFVPYTYFSAFLFGWSAVFPPRPASSWCAEQSGCQGKRAAARSHAQPHLCGEHGEHGEHWNLTVASTAPGLSGSGASNFLLDLTSARELGYRTPARYVKSKRSEQIAGNRADSTGRPASGTTRLPSGCLG